MIPSPGQFGPPPSGFDAPDPVQILIQLLMLLLIVGIFTFSIVVICLNLRAIKHTWRTALVVGLVVLLITMASSFMTMLLMDLEGVFIRHGGQGTPPTGLIYTVASIVIITLVSIKSGWYVLVFSAGAGEWGKAGLTAYPLLIRSSGGSWSGVWWGAGFGVLAGVVSTVVLMWMDIGMGPMLMPFMELFEQAEAMSTPLGLLFFSLMVLGPAITEELTYRGLMLGFLFKFCGGSVALQAVAIAAVAFVWALLHIPNTDMPFAKCAQIFLIGLVLGELARRRGIESAIAGHVMLNLSSVVCSVFYE